jgi:hypothetical protein
VSDQTTDGIFATDRLEQIIDAYVADYELVGEDEPGRDGCYAPTDTERGLIKDAIMGLLADDDWDAEWGKHIAQLANRDTAAYAASLASDNERLQAEVVQLRNLLMYADEWITSVPHGDNCWVSNHYAGDPGNRCNCGKESVSDALTAALSAKEPT